MSARPVNSGVRFLLNDLAQNIEAATLNFDEAADLSCVLMLLECCEPRARIAR
jgi:hypothetical protein